MLQNNQLARTLTLRSAKLFLSYLTSSASQIVTCQQYRNLNIQFYASNQSINHSPSVNDIGTSCLQKIHKQCNHAVASPASLSSSQATTEKDAESCTNSHNLYTNRTHNCGELNSKHIGRQVQLYGWIQYKRMKRFLVLRDSYGKVQLNLDSLQHQVTQQSNQTQQQLIDVHKMPLESVIFVSGLVVARPPDQVNPDMSTGEIEVQVQQLNLLGRCSNKLPFLVKDAARVREELRLQYRYLEMRSEHLQSALRFRSRCIQEMRNFLCKKAGFVEVETPTLFKRTPGGAQEFVVPTQRRGHFYSLVQSPQQFKQLLMIGGIDRYFQVARCYRDESKRADRQPEFTQLDIELSFTSTASIQQLIEDLLVAFWQSVMDGDNQLQTPFPRMTFKHAMDKFGTDQPDLRLELPLKRIQHADSNKNKKGQQLFVSSFSIENAFLLNPDEQQLLLSESEKLLRQFNLENNSELQIYLANSATSSQNSTRLDELDKENLAQFSQQDQKMFQAQILAYYLNNECQSSNWYWFVAGKDDEEVHTFLGRIRNKIIPMLLKNEQVAAKNGRNPEKYAFIWIIDFPLFTPKKAKNSAFNNASSVNQLESTHHPFTAPADEHQHLLYTDPAKVIGQSFDLVLNGSEIAGGSIRINDAEMQRYVFEKILGEKDSSMNYFVNALTAGCPPHGGAALGLDRLYALMLNRDSIRDVIAFPKTLTGKDLMSGAPELLSSTIKEFYDLK